MRYLPFLLLLIACKKEDDSHVQNHEQMRHIRYETKCAAAQCRIEYKDVPGNKRVTLENVPGNFTFEFELPVTQPLPVGALNVYIEDIHKAATSATAAIYVNDTPIDQHGGMYSGNASNRKAY